MYFDLLEERCSQLSERNIKAVQTCEARVSTIFLNDDNINLFNDKQLIIDFFSMGKIKSKSFFYTMKVIFQEYYKILFEKGLVTQETLDFVDQVAFSDRQVDQQLSTFYFHDLQSLINLITAVGVDYNQPASNKNMLNIKALVILYWYGFTNEEITEIFVENVGPEYITTDTKRVRIPEKYMKYIKWYAEAYEIIAFPSEKTAHLINGPYLCRTNREHQCTNLGLRSINRRLNAVLKDYGKQISIIALRQNRLFCDLIEIPDGLVTKYIMQTLNVDRSAAWSYKVQFDKWKEMYYQEEKDEMDTQS